MKFKSLVLVLFMIIFSSCSGGGFIGGGAQSGTEAEDRSGYGLEVSFDIEDRDIEIGRVDYELSLKNTGKLALILREEDFVIETPFSKEGEDVFSRESIDAMKKKLFGDNQEVTLQKDEKREISGLFEISAPFKGILEDSFEYKLIIEYQYRTEFNNNIELTLSNDKRPEFRITDSISQAAPIQITDIELKSDVGEGDYILEYTIEDRGKKGLGLDLTSDKTNKGFEIDRMDILLGTSSIYSRCEPWYKKGSEFSERVEGSLEINNAKGDLVLFCRISIPNTQGLTTTKTSGYMEYDYVYSKKGTLQFPQKKNLP